MKHYEYEISLFVDNELDNGQKEELFRHLAECDKCRQDMSDYLLLKQQSKSVIAENVSAVNLKPSRSKYFYKAGFYISAAAAILLIFILVNKTPKTVYIKSTPEITQTVVPEAGNISNQKEERITGVKAIKAERIPASHNYINYISGIPGIKLSEKDIITHDYRNDL
jgi:hypothetical protein